MISHSNRFKAAIAENPLTNWHSFYETSDIGSCLSIQQLGGKPHDYHDVYTNCSPISYAHNCKTPTLLIVSENDCRCPPEQSEQFFRLLKVAGCVTEMIVLKGEYHMGSIDGSIEARITQNEGLLTWIKRYV